MQFYLELRFRIYKGGVNMIKEFSIVCTEKIDIRQTLKYLVDAYGCYIPGYYII